MKPLSAWTVLETAWFGAMLSSAVAGAAVAIEGAFGLASPSTPSAWIMGVLMAVLYLAVLGLLVGPFYLLLTGVAKTRGYARPFANERGGSGGRPLS